MKNNTAVTYGAAAPDKLPELLAIAREYCDRKGFSHLAAFSDEHVLSVSAGGVGLRALRATVATGCVGAVVMGGVRDIALRVADLEALVRDMDAMSVQVHFSDLGLVTREIVELAAALNAKRRAHATWAGAQGRRRVAASGGVPTGGVFGYRQLPHDAGALEPEPEEAAVVRRIFASAAEEDRTPPEISRALAEAGLLRKSGQAYSSVAIVKILRRRLYRGDVIYGRYLHERDPRTGRVTRRERPTEEWVVSHVPELRLVDDDTWDLAQGRLN